MSALLLPQAGEQLFMNVTLSVRPSKQEGQEQFQVVVQLVINCTLSVSQTVRGKRDESRGIAAVLSLEAAVHKGYRSILLTVQSRRRAASRVYLQTQAGDSCSCRLLCPYDLPTIRRRRNASRGVAAVSNSGIIRYVTLSVLSTVQSRRDACRDKAARADAQL